MHLDVGGILEEFMSSVPRQNSIERGHSYRIPFIVEPIGPREVNLMDVLAGIELEGLRPLTAVLGLDTDHRPLLIRLPASEVGHVFILGDNGVGKSSLLRTLILSLALTNPQRHLQIVLLDPLHRQDSLRYLPHLLTPIATTRTEAVEILRFLLDRIGQRPIEPEIVVAVDDLDKWGDTLSPWISRLSVAGRQAGIHLVCCQRQIAGQIWKDVILVDVPVLVGRIQNRAERLRAGVYSLGVATLPSGEFVAVTGREIVGFRAAFVSEECTDRLAFDLWEVPGHNLILAG